MEDGFSITREDVIINYVPSSDVLNYSYKINDQESIYVNEGDTSLSFKEDGKYTIVFTNNNIDGSTSQVTYKYIIDKEAPNLNIKEKTYVLTTKDKLNLSVNAFDNYDGDLTDKIETNVDSINFKETGIKEVTLSVSDSAGNTSFDKVYVTVKKDNSSLLYLGWFILIIVVFLLISFLYKYLRSLKYEKRFSKFTINNHTKNNSLFDSIYNNYINFIDKYSVYLKSSSIMVKASKRYEKYNVDGIKFIGRKIVLGFIYIVLFIVLNLLKLRIIKSYEMIIPFILGYFTLDIIYYFKYKTYKKRIKNDLLSAITLLNNAFKSGKSIKQAINIVSQELDGPIALEFKKIDEELSYGLDIDVAFKRFKDRVNLEEASYLSASISVVNTTGGNIIKVFNSIEHTLYSKKKLNEELNALTSSSRFIMYVLILVPILFILFIGLINKDYFTPLFTHPLGIVLIGIELIIYIVYIIVVRKVMKIR